jgi:RecJ-like exonuclease
MEDPLKSMKVPDSMASQLKEAATMVESTTGTIRVLSHYDGDGICSAAVVSKALYRAGKRFQATMTEVLTPDDIDAMDGGFDLLIVTDMGSLLANRISERILDLGVRCIILDHHKTDGREIPFTIADGRGILEVNPRFHHINGTTGCCGSTLSFLLAVALSADNIDLSIFSLAGAIADRQHVPEFTELNLGVKKLALEWDLIEINVGMPMHGMTLKEALHMSNDPFIRGISGHPEEAESLLASISIDPDTAPQEPDRERSKVLQSLLYSHLLEAGVDYHRGHELFRENLISPRWGDLQALAYEIDSCGRLGEEGTGFDAVWGGKEARERAHENRMKYKRNIQKFLLDLLQKGVNEMEFLNWIEVEEDTLAGTVAGISHNYLFDHGKPMLAISNGTDGIKKVSGRGNQELISRGLDLGRTLG